MKFKYSLTLLLFPAHAFALDCELMPTPACEPPPINPEVYNASHNGFPTDIILLNKGGYNTRYRIDYSEGEHGEKRTIYSKSLPVGKNFVAKIPGNARSVMIMAELFNGFTWSKIYYRNVCINNNKWTYNNSNVNSYRIDNWGTTLQPKWAVQQPSDTHYNGANTAFICRLQSLID